MGDYQLHEPFFRRTAVAEAIDRIAHANPLTVFAGAGVAVDEIGLTWYELIVRLLEKKKVDRLDAQCMVDAIGVVNAGSIVAERYRRDHTGVDRIGLANDMKPLLYDSLFVLGGSTAAAISELVCDLGELGRDIGIKTTNFDDGLQSRIDHYRSLFSQRFTTPAPAVEYLHGMVPRNAETIDFPVLSELDFYETTPQVEATVRQALSASSMLIVGSSLTDRPLLNALLATRETAAGKGLFRLALLPRADLSAATPDAASVRRLELYEQRMEQLGVRVLFFDYYSQLAQFVAECRFAASLEAGEHSVSHPGAHGSRLGTWWTTWSAARPDPSDLHDLLNDTLSRFRAAARTPSHEMLKIDLWVRWELDKGDLRYFRLCASTHAIYPDVELSRTAHIVNNPDDPVIRAFRLGRVDDGDQSSGTSGHPDNSRAPLSARWRSYIAIPLFSRHAGAVVGVAVVASMLPPEAPTQGSLRHDNLMRHQAAVVGVRQDCIDLLDWVMPGSSD